MTHNGKPTPVLSAATFAERYMAAGLQVLPIRSDGSKSPAIKWAGLQDTSRRCKISDFSGRGVAIVCGRASGGLEVIDFDCPKFYPPWCELVEEQSPGLIQRLVMVQTPRQDIDGWRGIHVLYRCLSPEGNQILAYAAPDEGSETAKPSIETRGEGGYVLTVGSPPQCHPTGRTYDLLAGDLTEVPTITADERDVLLNAARALSRWQRDPAQGEQSSQYSRVESEKESPGDHFARVASWSEILEPHGWARAGQDRWRRPGKARGWSATTCCVSSAGNSLLKVFSSSAAPLEHLATYTKFAAYALLNHGGDYTAAARELKRRGFGSGGDSGGRSNHQQSESVEGFGGAGPRAGEADSGSSSPHVSNAPEAEQFVVPRIIDAADLVASYPCLAAPVIHDVLRVGETMNIIAASKMHKSYLTLDLALSVATGKPWLGVAGFPVTRGRVLLLDNELHRETLASRVAAVAAAKGLSPSDYHGWLEIDCLRGRTADITCMDRYVLAQAGRGISLLILDALYRFWPPRISENDNNAVVTVYNRIDRWADQLGCGVTAVHHSSKGVQAGKSVVDVGAGAGAIARAADTHMILRPHAKPNHVVLDLVTRSFPPTEAFSLEWQYPLWLRSAEKPVLDVGEKRQGLQQKVDDSEAVDLLLRVMREVGGGPVTRGYLRTESGWGATKVNRLARIALDQGLIRKAEILVRGKKEEGFELANGSP